MTKSAKSKLYIAIALILCYIFKPKKAESPIKTTDAPQKPKQSNNVYTPPASTKATVSKESYIRKNDKILKEQTVYNNKPFTPKGSPNFTKITPIKSSKINFNPNFKDSNKLV